MAAMNPADWRTSLGFSARLSTVTKMQVSSVDTVLICLPSDHFIEQPLTRHLIRPFQQPKPGVKQLCWKQTYTIKLSLLNSRISDFRR
ncbi:hypothetical protein DM02DRAFT_389964 [Periconia macrospinosa]|uniref:Uncharacterized protein n=1 Tax=Periconia macrospinosa TaxID=97972 RepID=A0A2V1DQV3_9PLEO|nr:hypothetical protein DM02DRAFT_389964 [Periconia macrospinosa]